MKMSIQEETRTAPNRRAITSPPMPIAPPKESILMPVSKLIAQGQAMSETNDTEERSRTTASENIVSGLDFLSAIMELRQQLQELQQLKLQTTKVNPEDEPESGNESWLGKAFGVARSTLRSKNPYDDEANLVAYEKELSLWAEYFHYSYLLRQIVKTSQDWQRILCVMASKGGVSKTPFIVYMAAIFAFATSTTNLLLEANENDGTVKNRYGLARDSQPLLNDVIADHSLIADHRTATDMLGKFEQTSVWALLSAANAAENQFSMPEFLAMFDKIRPHFCNVWGDTGNGNRLAANEGMFLESDIAFFPALAGNSDSWSTVITTMINLHQAGHVEKLQKRSFVVISATKEGDTIEQFLKIFREVAAEAVKPRYNYKSGVVDDAPLWTEDPDQLLRDIGFKYDADGRMTGEGVFVVRHSDWIDDGNIVSVRPEDVGLETIVDYLKIAVAAFTVPTQDKEVKKSEIARRIGERKEKPSSQVIGKQQALSGLLEAFGDDTEGVLLFVAAQIERAKELAASA
jgi:hypothetical protein